MKKIICSILSIALISTMLCVTASALVKDDSSLCFAVASDLHYNHSGEELVKTNEDEIFWYANRRAAMEEESGFIIDEFLNQCAEDDNIEYVLISGDLADNGKTMPEDHLAVAEKLREFEAKSGKQVFVINGNHDAGENCKTTTDDFINIYREFGYDKALSTTSYDCSYTADLGDKYRLIALDSNDPSKSTEDGMSLKKIRWVQSEAKKAYADGKYPILMMHHNLLDHLPLQRIISRNFIVRFHFSTATLFAGLGIKLVLSGHEHCSDATSYTTPSGDRIYDFATTSLSMYPLSYRVFSLTEEAIAYESRTIENIDTDALLSAQPGFTEKQLNLMNEGLNAYALSFLKTGVEYRLALSLSPEKMGIDEDAFYYDLVMTAVDGLTDILEMQLYGENSVSSLAGEYGISIPESKYNNLWDLATSLVASHYAGEENLTIDSDEVKILLRGVSLILKDDLSNYNDKVIFSWATKLLEKNGKNGITNSLAKICSGATGGIRADEYFTAALLSSFLYEFAFDSDTVNDNNGIIEGYGANDNCSNIKSDITYKFEKFVTYIKIFFSLIGKIFGINR